MPTYKSKLNSAEEQRARSVPLCSRAQGQVFQNQQDSGGSVWESNLLFTDTSSTYEEALGLSWKDLASLGTLIAALLLPRFLIPLFSQAEPFQRLCCLLSASRQASLACRYSRLSGSPRDPEVPPGPSDPLAGSAAGSSKNAETYASQSCQDRYEYRSGAGSCSGLSTSTEAFRSRRDSGIANRCPQRLARALPYIRAGH